MRNNEGGNEKQEIYLVWPKIKTICNTASTYRISSVSRFSMTFIEGLRLLLDMATVDKTGSSK